MNRRVGDGKHDLPTEDEGQWWKEELQEWLRAQSETFYADEITNLVDY
jgi:hypothetical protein